ncbi:polysaccharide deacetylase family protein [Ruegeria sp. EL01]|jgi:hypothetical protein|uniref:polysaccharide deacetylase family protein n=1 Tax=Ruegeria sp. EL01 TaxID=2107578 RepID=UPI000EA810FC|nr:polysaccharide deacetylase family protein [Ruegeria sp. EL01]
MIPGWQPLDAELKLWLDQGISLPLWWRDDDTVSRTPQLDRLSDMSEQLGLPVHLAIIPRDVDPDLVAYTSQRPTLVPVVHGWAHMNHAPKGEKKSEFGLYRPLEDIVADARAGYSKLKDLFGDDLRPMFVPPWNRIDAEAVARLPEVGFRILSTATPRKQAQAAPGLDQINTHIDPIDWHGGRGLIPADTLIIRTADLLRDRREGRADNTEPFGVLTHHLVHDQDIWDFTKALLRKLVDGPAKIWTAPRT